MTALPNQFQKNFFYSDQHTKEILESQVIVTREVDGNSRPVALSFRCKRFVPGINPQIQNVFQNAIAGLAHVNMDPPSGNCPHDYVTRGCGNSRNKLTECRCEVLDRRRHPEIRYKFENNVIDTCLSIVGNHSPFHLKLALFCSGQLFGEQILVFRLVEELRKKGLKGTVELFLIDKDYRSVIQNSTTDSFENSLGRQGYMQQFLEEICQFLPTGISVQGTFFGDNEEYVRVAQANPQFKHHLLAGADIEDANVDMGHIGKEAGLGREPIALVKISRAAICGVEHNGRLVNCNDPSNVLLQNASPQQPSEREDAPQSSAATRRAAPHIEWGAIATIIGGLLIIYILLRSRSR